MKRGESGISCLVGVDKPAGPSSHGAVAVVRRALGERRVGHAGTLDPLASGVLVLGVGQATRLLGLLTLDDKRYEARIALGEQTTTDDAEGEVVRTGELRDEFFDETYARSVVSGLVGSHDQVPPAFSAISIGGKRSYARARAGEQIELEARRVHIYEASLTGMEREPRLVWHVSLHVSKGAYVRSIARDLGEKLGCGAHLLSLRRTASGSIDESLCVSLDDLSQVGPALALARCLDPAKALGFPMRLLSSAEFDDVRCGRKIEIGTVLRDGQQVTLQEGDKVCLVANQQLYGVWRRHAGSLASVASFPDGVVGVRV